MKFFDLLFRKAREYGIKVIGSDISIDVKTEAMRNVWVVACIEAIVNSLLRMGYEKDEKIIDGILSFDEIIRVAVYDLFISGNAFLKKVEVGGKISLFPYEPENCYIWVENSNIRFKYKDTEIDYSSIIHLKNIIPNENDIRRVIVGDSIVKQIYQVIRLDNLILEMNLANIQTNNMTLIASFRDIVDESVLKRLESALRYEIERGKKIHFLISPIPMDVKEIKTDDRGIFVEFQKELAIKILSVFRVPPIILGFGDSGNYINRKEQIRSFYENAVFPVATRLESAFEKHGLKLTFNRNNPDILQDTLFERVNILNSLLMVGYPVRQACKIVGLPEPEMRSGIEGNEENESEEDEDEENEKEKENEKRFTKNFLLRDVVVVGNKVKVEFITKHIKLSKEIRTRLLNLITTARNVFFDEYIENVLKAYESGNLPELDALLDNWASFVNPMFEVNIRDTFIEILEDYKDIPKLQLGGEILKYTLIDVIGTRHAKKITRINDTVKNQIREKVIEGLQIGKGTLEISQDIGQVFKAQRNRLNTIARTETTSILNDFSIETARSIDMEWKIWLTAHDEAVRQSHSEIDFFRQAITEPFPNGLQYPGDVNGEAGEVINCRCTLIFE